MRKFVMLFTTSLLGNVEVDESNVIEFPQGLPGFENCTRFKLFHDATSATPQVFWMQSLDDADLLFSVTEPERLGLRYELDLSDQDVALLQLTRAEDALIVVMVYKEDQAGDELHPLLSPIKANVRNPLVLNLATRLGLQKTNLSCEIVLHNHPQR
jgi:flagellar assembly factor FliW